MPWNTHPRKSSSYKVSEHSSTSFGLILLVLGRKLFWLCVAILGFFLGMVFAGTVLVDQPAWVTFLMGLGAGLLGGLLAILAQRLAFAIAGFYAGAYLALSAAVALEVGNHGTLWVVAGGVIGTVLATRARQTQTSDLADFLRL